MAPEAIKPACCMQSERLIVDRLLLSLSDNNKKQKTGLGDGRRDFGQWRERRKNFLFRLFPAARFGFIQVSLFHDADRKPEKRLLTTFSLPP